VVWPRGRLTRWGCESLSCLLRTPPRTAAVSPPTADELCDDVENFQLSQAANGTSQHPRGPYYFGKLATGRGCEGVMYWFRTECDSATGKRASRLPRQARSKGFSLVERACVVKQMAAIGDRAQLVAA